MLLDALERLPTVGFLAADLEENDADVASRLRHRDRADHYEEEYVNDVRLLSGPTGGACAMTSRAIYDKAGGFPQNRRIFFQEEANYIARVEALGLRKAILADLRVSHTGGEYAGGAAAKDAYWRDHWRTVRRKNFIKRLLFAFPGVPALNARFSWFGPSRGGRRDSAANCAPERWNDLGARRAIASSVWLRRRGLVQSGCCDSMRASQSRWTQISREFPTAIPEPKPSFLPPRLLLRCRLASLLGSRGPRELATTGGPR